MFEKRSAKLRNQPGEICFPGGKLEPGESLQECAIRETMEELKICAQQIEILGPGDIYISPFNLMLHPFIGVLKEYQNTFSTDEVDEVIPVPLDFFYSREPERFESKLLHELPENFPYEWIPGGISYPWKKGSYEILFYHDKDLIIWGMTAQIAHSAVKLLKQYRIQNEKSYD